MLSRTGYIGKFLMSKGERLLNEIPAEHGYDPNDAETLDDVMAYIHDLEIAVCVYGSLAYGESFNDVITNTTLY